MKLAVPITQLPAEAKTGPPKLRAANSIEQEKKRLRQATKEFEAFFNYYMLKTMRQTIPKSGLEEDLPLGNTDGQEQFTDMFDMEIAKAGTGGPRSISELLYRSLEKTVAAKFNAENGTSPAEVSKAPKFLPIHTPGLNIKPLQQGPVPIDTKSGQPIPIQTKNLQAPHQPKLANPIIQKYGEHIDAAARETQLDSTLIASVIQAESGGNQNAVSKAGAKGLMQLADTTAQDYGVKNAFDPAENIMAGSRFLKSLLDRYQDLKLALAAYNAGPKTVDKYGGIPPYKETRDYVTKVTNRVNHTDMLSALAKGTARKADN